MMFSEDTQVTGIVFNIQHYSVHDGPGHPFQYLPERLSPGLPHVQQPRIPVPQARSWPSRGRCLGLDKCTRCLGACPHQATARRDGKPVIDRTLCRDCAFQCAAACPPHAAIVYGEHRTVDSVLQEVEKQEIFFSTSGGGITLSGGEPLFQEKFALALLREARRRRLATAVETTGFMPWERLEQAVELLDTVIFDIKHIDPSEHRKGTGVDNGLHPGEFPASGHALPPQGHPGADAGHPGCNDTQDVLTAIAELVRPFPQVRYEPLPYHRLGTQKYTFIGKTCPMGDRSSG